MTKIDHSDCHQSGRYDATVAQKHHMVDEVVAQCSVAVITEAVGWQLARSTWSEVGHETKVIWSDSRWRRQDAGHPQIHTGEWVRGTDHRDYVEIQWALLQHRETGHTLLRAGGHLPAHLYRPAQSRANLAGLRGIPDVLGPVIGDHKPDKVIVSLDFNRELTLKRNHYLIQHAVRGANVPLKVIAPPKGTFGLRKIDGYLTDNGYVTMLDRLPGFDHRGMVLHTQIHEGS